MPAPFDLTFSLHDSARQQPWPIRVPRGEPIAFYACGITPYAAPHVGHARSFVVFDALRRVLEAFGWPVRLVRNITDVDDKIIAAAASECTDWHTLAHRWADHNRGVFQSLGVAATEEPSVSEHMTDIVALIERLVAKNHAYAEPSGDVYFAMDTFRGTDVAHQPAEALLSHRAAGRVAHTGKRQAADFALWKAAKPGEPAWPSPWGLGRPGWHVECSAMIEALFGQTLTIHGGGSDLRFPHHQCEVCQSEAAFDRPLADHWIHHGSVLHEGQKMSKSLGNVVSVADALGEAEALRPGQGGALVRWALLQAQWTKPLDWQSGLLERASADLAKFSAALQRVLERVGKPTWRDLPAASLEWSGAQDFWQALADNFNIPRAVASLHQAAQAVLRKDAHAEAAGQFLGEALSVLGLTPDLWPEAWRWTPTAVPDEVMSWVHQREAARAARDFAAADAWRHRLLERGWQVLDRPSGPEVVAVGNG